MTIMTALDYLQDASPIVQRVGQDLIEKAAIHMESLEKELERTREELEGLEEQWRADNEEKDDLESGRQSAAAP